MKQVRYYAGIGSRRTPPQIIKQMHELADTLGKMGYTLRSGYADGADKAFHLGATSNGRPVQNWLPWKGFNGCEEMGLYAETKHFDLAKLLHPVWGKLPESVHKLHARNVGQVLGRGFEVADVQLAILNPHLIHYPTLSEPSEFVVCWTPDGADAHDLCTSKTGGTGTAIKLADYCQIPVFNLFNTEAYEELLNHLTLPRPNELRE